MNCWFCRGHYRRGNVVPPEPDGKPLCGYCKAQLEDFAAWLRAL